MTERVKDASTNPKKKFPTRRKKVEDPAVLLLPHP
jgi:hypothetical protein